MAEPPTPPDDLFARGLAAGRRAVLRELFGVLDPFARELDGQGLRGPARFAPGIDPARLDRFLAATSAKAAATETPAPQPVRLGVTHLKEAERENATGRVGGAEIGGRENFGPVEALSPIIAAPVIDGERPTAPSESTRANSDVADFVKQRGMEWWEKSKLDDFEPLVRAEARSIAAELFELAEELRRGDHLR